MVLLWGKRSVVGLTEIPPGHEMRHRVQQDGFPEASTKWNGLLTAALRDHAFTSLCSGYPKSCHDIPRDSLLQLRVYEGGGTVSSLAVWSYSGLHNKCLAGSPC